MTPEELAAKKARVKERSLWVRTGQFPEPPQKHQAVFLDDRRLGEVSIVGHGYCVVRLPRNKTGVPREFSRQDRARITTNVPKYEVRSSKPRKSSKDIAGELLKSLPKPLNAGNPAHPWTSRVRGR